VDYFTDTSPGPDSSGRFDGLSAAKASLIVVLAAPHHRRAYSAPHPALRWRRRIVVESRLRANRAAAGPCHGERTQVGSVRARLRDEYRSLLLGRWNARGVARTHCGTCRNWGGARSLTRPTTSAPSGSDSRRPDAKRRGCGICYIQRDCHVCPTPERGSIPSPAVTARANQPHRAARQRRTVAAGECSSKRARPSAIFVLVSGAASTRPAAALGGRGRAQLQRRDVPGERSSWARRPLPRSHRLYPVRSDLVGRDAPLEYHPVRRRVERIFPARLPPAAPAADRSGLRDVLVLGSIIVEGSLHIASFSRPHGHPTRFLYLDIDTYSQRCSSCST